MDLLKRAGYEQELINNATAFRWRMKNGVEKHRAKLLQKLIETKIENENEILRTTMHVTRKQKLNQIHLKNRNQNY